MYRNGTSPLPWRIYPDSNDDTSEDDETEEVDLNTNDDRSSEVSARWGGCRHDDVVHDEFELVFSSSPLLLVLLMLLLLLFPSLLAKLRRTELLAVVPLLGSAEEDVIVGGGGGCCGWNGEANTYFHSSQETSVTPMKRLMETKEKPADVPSMAAAAAVFTMVGGDR